MLPMWEIMVPTMRNNGRPYTLRYHRVWDAKVREIAGGLTILRAAVGQWVNEGEVFIERMIPVRIACTREQIVEIMRMTAKYYDQIDVMAMQVSTDVIFLSKEAS